MSKSIIIFIFRCMNLLLWKGPNVHQNSVDMEYSDRFQQFQDLGIFSFKVTEENLRKIIIYIFSILSVTLNEKMPKY